MKGKVYEIRLPEREKKTKSFGNTIVGFDFKLSLEWRQGASLYWKDSDGAE